MGRSILAQPRIGDLGIAKAMHLYGRIDSCISFGHQTFLDGKPFTFGVRIFPTNSSMATDESVFAYGFDATTGRGYVFRADGATRKMYLFYGSSFKTTENYRLIGKHYLFVDFDGVATARVFKNALLMDTLAISPAVAHTTNGVFFGTRDNITRFYQGVVGDGCIYDRLLTDAERADIVTNAKYPSGSLLQFKADENTGTTIIDYSGNGRDGTATSVLWRNSPFNA